MICEDVGPSSTTSNARLDPFTQLSPIDPMLQLKFVVTLVPALIGLAVLTRTSPLLGEISVAASGRFV